MNSKNLHPTLKRGDEGSIEVNLKAKLKICFLSLKVVVEIVSMLKTRMG